MSCDGVRQCLVVTLEEFLIGLTMPWDTFVKIWGNETAHHKAFMDEVHLQNCIIGSNFIAFISISAFGFR